MEQLFLVAIFNTIIEKEPEQTFIEQKRKVVMLKRLLDLCDRIKLSREKLDIDSYKVLNDRVIIIQKTITMRKMKQKRLNSLEKIHEGTTQHRELSTPQHLPNKHSKLLEQRNISPLEHKTNRKLTFSTIIKNAHVLKIEK